jgi:hypothetical protein
MQLSNLFEHQFHKCWVANRSVFEGEFNMQYSRPCFEDSLR